jgi:hypothetical protein
MSFKLTVAADEDAAAD